MIYHSKQSQHLLYDYYCMSNLIGLFMGNTLPYYTEGYCTLFNWHLQESTARSSLNHN